MTFLLDNIGTSSLLLDQSMINKVSYPFSALVTCSSMNSHPFCYRDYDNDSVLMSVTSPTDRLS